MEAVLQAEAVRSYWIVMLAFLAVAAAAYFLGCFNGAVIVSKYILKDDIRTHGSGNGGLTNFYRVFGGGLTLVVILTDVIKAVFAVLIGAAVLGSVINAPVMGKFFAGMFCMIGHMYPCMFGFKGGKGILTGGTVACMLDWRLALIVWGAFILLTVLTKWVSLGSICAGVSFPIAAFLVFHNPWYTGIALVCGVLIVWKHRGNLQRIVKGEESKFSFHRKGDKGGSKL